MLWPHWAVETSSWRSNDHRKRRIRCRFVARTLSRRATSLSVNVCFIRSPGDACDPALCEQPRLLWVCDVGSRPCCHTVVGLYCQDAFGTAWCMPLPTLRPRCLCLTPVCTAACGLLSACWLAAFLVLCACPEPPPRCQFWQKEEASIAVTEPGLAGQHRIRRHLACRCASQQRCFTSHSRDPSSPAFGPPASTS